MIIVDNSINMTRKNGYACSLNSTVKKSKRSQFNCFEKWNQENAQTEAEQKSGAMGILEKAISEAGILQEIHGAQDEKDELVLPIF